LKHLIYLIEYLALKSAMLLLRLFPFAFSAGILGILAGLWFTFDRRHRRIAIDNILRAGLTNAPAEAKRMARRSFRHFAVLVLESIRARQVITAENWRDHVQVEMPPETMELIRKQGCGLILASGHLGNWEIAALALSFMKPTVGITRNFKNPYINRLMLAEKPTGNFRLTPKHDADPLRLVRSLKHGELLAILIDQHAVAHGMMIPFFGHPASTHTSAAMLHLVTRAPVCFGYCVRTGHMKFKLIANLPFSMTPTGNRDADTRMILTWLSKEMEKAIRAYPDQYLWAHRRWRDKAPAISGSTASLQNGRS
jgi:Kdo2-lipid IVA lauroyltransferase/acyltransferase